LIGPKTAFRMTGVMTHGGALVNKGKIL